MRIAFVNYTSRKIGGVESYLQAVLPFFAERGHTLSYWAETDIPGHRPAIVLPQNTQFWSAAADQLGVDAAIGELREWRPDVLYVHKVDHPETERRLLDIGPAVFFSHDYHGTCISGTKSFSFPAPRPCHRKFGLGCFVCYYPRRCGGLSPITMVKLYRRQSTRLALMRRYRSVLVASEHMAREYRRHGIDAHTIVHTHKGLSDGGPLSPVKPPLSGILRLAFLGRMEKLKGISHLLRALPRVAKELNNKIVCNIGGQGNDERRLRSIALRVTRDNLAITVNFRGWLNPLQCQQLLSESHLMVMPSVWPEPFGGVGSLAGELNVPAVAFNVGGISEWLHDGINGVLAPGDPPTPEGLADAIIRAVRDPDLYKQLCEGAHRYSRGASMVEHVASVEDWLARAHRGDQSIPNVY